MPNKNIPETIQNILNHKACGAVLKHWMELSEISCPPEKKRLDPLKFWSALPDISLHIYDPDINDYRMELAGDNILDLGFMDKKGVTLRQSYSQYSSEIADYIIAKWNKIRRTNKCLFTYRDLEEIGKTKASLRCCLPLAHPEAILCHTIYGYNAVYAHEKHKRKISDYSHISYSLDDLKHMTMQTVKENNQS